MDFEGVLVLPIEMITLIDNRAKDTMMVSKKEGSPA